MPSRYEDRTVAELQETLRERGMAVSGTKGELIARLRGEAEEGASAPSDPLDDDAPAYVHYDADLAEAKAQAAADREAHSLAFEAAVPADPVREGVVHEDWRSDLLRKAYDGDERARATIDSLLRSEEEAKQFARLGFDLAIARVAELEKKEA